jgi:hypothetical protein
MSRRLTVGAHNSESQNYEEQLNRSRSASTGSKNGMGGLGTHFTRLPGDNSTDPKTTGFNIAPLLDSAKKHFFNLRDYISPKTQTPVITSAPAEVEEQVHETTTPRGWELVDETEVIIDQTVTFRKPVERGKEFDVTVFASPIHEDFKNRTRLPIIQSLFQNRQVCDELMKKIKDELKKRNFLNVEERISYELDTLINILKRPRAAILLIFEKDNRQLINFIVNHRNILYKERKLYVACCMTCKERDGGGMNHIFEDPHPDLTTEDALDLLFFLPQNTNFRKLAITVLERRPLDEVQVFLPQLLQMVYHFGEDTSMATYLLKLAIRSTHIYNQFSWLLLVQQQAKPSPYLEQLHERLLKLEGCESDVILFNRQRKLVTNLNNMSRYLKTYLGNISREDRIRQLKTILEGTHNFPQFMSMINLEKGTVQTQQNLQDQVCKMYDWAMIFPLRVPLQSFHELTVTAIKTEEISIFKSAMAPLKIPFIIEGDEQENLKIIFKRGDDLRQDALMMQVIQFMNDVLLSKGLDLCLSTYDVMALGLDHGMVELVPNSHTIASVLESHKSIYEFLASKNESYENFEKALRNFTKSCAGYCVITFLLGIGDRHLDNSKLFDYIM